MKRSENIRDFLVTRRAKITPEQAGLPSDGRRRVPGLRRSEVAVLSGVSTDYYSHVERGNSVNVSDTVLDAIARALQLDTAERAYLFDVARPSPEQEVVPDEQLRPGLVRILDGMPDLPAIVQNGRLDLLAANRLGTALFCALRSVDGRSANFATFVFTDPKSREFFADWEEAADSTVALLRAEAGRKPADRHLAALVAELSAGSTAFANRWASHDVVVHRFGQKRFQHPAAGILTLDYERMDLSPGSGMLLTVYTAESGTPSSQALDRLSGWATESPSVG